MVDREKDLSIPLVGLIQPLANMHLTGWLGNLHGRQFASKHMHTGTRLLTSTNPQKDMFQRDNVVNASKEILRATSIENKIRN